MQKRKWRKIALWATGIFMGLVAILAVHIWWVMKPRVDARTRVMARIDLHQAVSPVQAREIQAWLYSQQGVKYVFVNAASKIAVFSYAPLENDANRIVAGFKAGTGYSHAVRYLPSQIALSGSCPVAATSFAYKTYAFMQRVMSVF